MNLVDLVPARTTTFTAEPTDHPVQAVLRYRLPGRRYIITGTGAPLLREALPKPELPTPADADSSCVALAQLVDEAYALADEADVPEMLAEMEQRRARCTDGAYEAYRGILGTWMAAVARTAPVDLQIGMRAGDRVALRVVRLQSDGVSADRSYDVIFSVPGAATLNPDEIGLTVFASGEVKSGISKRTDEVADLTGSLGVGVDTYTFYLNTSISIFGDDRDVVRDFGRAVLIPTAGNAFQAGTWDMTFRPFFAQIPARDRRWDLILREVTTWILNRTSLRFYATATAAEWTLAEKTVVDGTTVLPGSADIAIGAGGIGFYGDIVNQRVQGNRVLIRVHAMPWAFRGLYGDLSSPANATFRQVLLGTDERFFWGTELGLTLHVNSVRANLTLHDFNATDFHPWLPFREFEDAPDVPGLTGGQVTASIILQGDIIRAVGTWGRTLRPGS